jgi:Mg2+ and Co2+ transporter CorA
MIPTGIGGFFGMNVPNGLETNVFAFGAILVGTAILSLMGYLYMKKKNLF